jgi:hypothetical protein
LRKSTKETTAQTIGIKNLKSININMKSVVAVRIVTAMDLILKGIETDAITPNTRTKTDIERGEITEKRVRM